jgi:hypothetical protein
MGKTFKQRKHNPYEKKRRQYDDGFYSEQDRKKGKDRKDRREKERFVDEGNRQYADA